MATNSFKNALKASIGTSAQTVYTAPSGKTSIIIELDLANRSNSGVYADVTITDNSGSVTSYLVKAAPIPTGGTLQVISGQKIVLEGNDYIQVASTAASSVDAVAAILEDV